MPEEPKLTEAQPLQQEQIAVSGHKSIEPSQAFAQEIQMQRATEAAAVAGQSAVTATVAPAAPQEVVPPSPFMNTPEASVVSQRSRSRIYLVGITAICVVVIGLVGLYFGVVRHHNDTSKLSNTVATASSGPTPLEKKLADHPDYLAKVQAFALPVYAPKDQTIRAASVESGVINGARREHVQYSFGANASGQGLVLGAYSVDIATVDDRFKPPADCGLTLGYGKSSKPIVCTPYRNANKELPAYYHQGWTVQSGIQNTSIPENSYIAMYVVRDGNLIIIQTAGASPDQLYDLVSNMKTIRAIDLPADTNLYFK